MKKLLVLLLAFVMLLSSCAVIDAEPDPAGKVIPPPNKKTETKPTEEISALMFDGTNYWPKYAWPHKHLSSLQDFEDSRNFDMLDFYLKYLLDLFREDINANDGEGSMDYFGFIKSVLISHKGHVVYDYNAYPSDKYEVNTNWSLTKSFVSAIVGIAIGEGLIKLDDKVLDYFTDLEIENVDDNKKAMTIRDVLTMQSGLKWDDGSSTRSLNNDENPVLTLLSSPMECAPGTQFSYNTSSTSILTSIIQQVTGKTAYEYAKEKIFDVIGISSATWEADKQGVNIGGFGLNMTAEDLLRFGHLYLHNGIWDGVQVVPAEWVKESTKTQVDLQTNGSKKAEEFKNTGSYGYHWWTPSGDYDMNVKRDTRTLVGSGPLPSWFIYFENNTVLKDGDIFRATGYAGQYIYVIPKYDMVVAITGTIINSPVDMGNYLVLNHILPNMIGYGKHTTFDDEDEFNKFSAEIGKFDNEDYINSKYLY